MKKKLDIKKLILLNLPYVFAFYFVNKLATVFRLAPGDDLLGKLAGGFANFGSAFAIPCPASIRLTCSSVLQQELYSSWRSI